VKFFLTQVDAKKFNNRQNLFAACGKKKYFSQVFLFSKRSPRSCAALNPLISSHIICLIQINWFSLLKNFL
jgi:hypothetical protein